MRAAPRNKNYVFLSLTLHALLLAVFILGFDSSSPLPVIENTNKQDVISAVILGDTAKSKIVPRVPAVKPPAQELEAQPRPEAAAKPKLTKPKEDTIALQALDKKKLAEKKALEEKKLRDMFAKKLLADIEQESSKKKKIKQKKLKSQFEKALQEQAEQSLRQQLFNEEIKLKGTQSRQANGEVNKYKALIIQAISENWIIPSQANKRLYCELMIRVAPGGMVLDVQITKSSGDPSLDSSARAAVLKSSPLPVPSDPKAFDAFRQFVLKVKPENVLASDGGLASG